MSICTRLGPNLHNTIWQINRLYNNVSNKQYSISTLIKSKEYPDYKVIYIFPYITYTQLLNKIKRNFTVLYGVSVPIVTVAGMMNTISTSDSLSFVCGGFVIGLSLHLGCFICNNLIGCMYFKEENQKVIISYINYWGKRIDLPTNIDHISPLAESPLNTNNNLYNYLRVQSCNKNLKILLKHGKVIGTPDFYKAVGVNK